MVIEQIKLRLACDTIAEQLEKIKELGIPENELIQGLIEQVRVVYKAEKVSL